MNFVLCIPLVVFVGLHPFPQLFVSFSMLGLSGNGIAVVYSSIMTFVRNLSWLTSFSFWENQKIRGYFLAEHGIESATVQWDKH